MRTAAVLQTRDELQQNAVDAVAEARLVPLDLARVLLALVEQQRLHVVVGERLARDVEVAVADRLEDRVAAAAAPALQQRVLRVQEADDPRVALRRRLLVLHVDALLG